MSHLHTVHLSESPNILTLLSRAALPKKSPTQINIPSLSVDLKGVKVDAKRLMEYGKVCGFKSKSHLPATFPHVMAFPLHMKLLTDSKFPIPLLGLVHYKNSMTIHRPVNVNEIFDIHCRLTNGRKSNMGTTFELITTISVGGTVVWEETSTFLQRSKHIKRDRQKTRKAIPTYQNSETWRLSSELGRRYAKVSADFNLIHLFSWSAKLFGFKHAIAHGMWSKTRCIAALSEPLGERAFKVDVAFKLPVFLPGTTSFNWQQHDDRIDFQLLDKHLTKPHLTGKVTLI